jgi:hypothetical protein
VIQPNTVLVDKLGLVSTNLQNASHNIQRNLNIKDDEKSQHKPSAARHQEQEECRKTLESPRPTPQLCLLRRKNALSSYSTCSVVPPKTALAMAHVASMRVLKSLWLSSLEMVDRILLLMTL